MDLEFRVASARIPMAETVKKNLVEEARRLVKENDGLIKGKFSPIERDAVLYVQQLAAAVSHHDTLGKFWQQSTNAIEGFPSYYPAPIKKGQKSHLPGEAPNFGTFLQRGLFGLDKLLADSGISENTSQPDMPIVDNDGNIIGDRRAIEIKSASSKTEHDFGLHVGNITIGQEATKDLKSLLEDKKFESQVMLYRMINKMNYLLWLRFESPADNPEHAGRLYFKVMILFMRLKIKKILEMINTKDTKKPRIILEPTHVVKNVPGMKLLPTETWGENVELDKRQFSVRIMWGESVGSSEDIMRNEVKVLTSMYEIRHDYINTLKKGGRTAWMFYKFIFGRVLKTMSFVKLGEGVV